MFYEPTRINIDGSIIYRYLIWLSLGQELIIFVVMNYNPNLYPSI